MANEISLTAKLTATKNSVSVTQNTSTKTQTIQTTLNNMHHTVQSVGTTTEGLSSGDVSLGAQYMVQLYNRDATNFVEVYVMKDVSTETKVGVLRPGEPWGPARMPAQSSGYPSLYLKADTAACDVEVTVIEAGDPAT